MNAPYLDGRKNLLCNCDPNEANRSVLFPRTAPEALCNIGHARHAQQTDCQIANCSHYLGPRMLANSGTVLIEGHIADPMNPVFDRPVITVEIEQSCRFGLVGGKAADSVGVLGTKRFPLEMSF